MRVVCLVAVVCVQNVIVSLVPLLLFSVYPIIVTFSKRQKFTLVEPQLYLLLSIRDAVTSVA